MPSSTGIVRRTNWLRYSYAPFFAAVVRISGALWLYHLLSGGGEFHTPWMDANPSLFLLGSTSTPIPAGNWLWLFNAWDSPHYLLIATFGYSHPQYVFLPGYPIFIRLLGFLIGSYPVGAFLVTQFFALGSIVVFQLLAEKYMAQEEALLATLLLAAFPYYVVFATLGYSEALFFFASVAAWYLYKTERLAASAVMAAIASITRIYGAAIILPIFADIDLSGRRGRLVCLLSPAAALGLWGAYCYISTGNPLVSWTDEASWVFDSKLGLAQTIVTQLGFGIHGCCTLDPGILLAVALITLATVIVWKVDHALWMYTTTIVAALLFVVINHLSILRYLTFLFPVWLIVRTRNVAVAAISMALFIPMSLLLWYYAIAYTFIG